MTAIRLVCATRLSRDSFFEEAVLGRSIKRMRDIMPQCEMWLFDRNTQGLPTVYNSAIKAARDLPEPMVLVFLHDDVDIVDYYWTGRLFEGLNQFDVVGVAGNQRRLPRQPGWGFVDLNCTWDDRAYLSGVVGHQLPTMFLLGAYGPAPCLCKLLDGVFLGVLNHTFRDHDLWFDERFDFHHYDLDFCREADRRGLRLGTIPISLLHNSVGDFESEAWAASFQIYLDKWGE